jgi:hypothetical protein
LEDEKALEFQKVVVDIFHDFQGNVVIFDTFPFLLPITPHFVMEKLGVTRYMEDCDILMSHMKVRCGTILLIHEWIECVIHVVQWTLLVITQLSVGVFTVRAKSLVASDMFWIIQI